MVRLDKNARAALQRIYIFQQTLGVRAGVSRGDVGDFERGKRNFRISTAVKLAGTLKADLAGLFSGVGDWYVRPLPAPEYAPGDPVSGKAERDALLMRLWRERKSEREIAEALDLASCAVAPCVRELRDAGLGLPHRRPPRTPIEAAARRRRDACSRELSRS
jgi:DNA-binding XRE family transcriptional regulator